MPQADHEARALRCALAMSAFANRYAAELAARGPELAKVLARCSYLVDGVAVRDKNVPLSTSETLDVLPPFAGG